MALLISIIIIILIIIIVWHPKPARPNIVSGADVEAQPPEADTEYIDGTPIITATSCMMYDMEFCGSRECMGAVTAQSRRAPSRMNEPIVTPLDTVVNLAPDDCEYRNKVGYLYKEPCYYIS